MSIQPEGEDLRKAVKWISDQRNLDNKKELRELINDASLKFNLSPKDEAFLSRFFLEK
jgi:hypothetical protein